MLRKSLGLYYYSIHSKTALLNNKTEIELDVSLRGSRWQFPLLVGDIRRKFGGAGGGGR